MAHSSAPPCQSRPGERLVRRGVRLGVDVGSVRVGLAVSDPDGVLATPVETLARQTVRAGADAGTSTSDVPADLRRIADEVVQRGAIEVLVGLPRSLSGGEGPAAKAARDYARALSRVVAVPVRLVDERLSTVAAHRSLRDAGMKGRKQRAVVDQVAAVVLLQNALDRERGTGRPPGVELD